jgi:hypothetical protein
MEFLDSAIQKPVSAEADQTGRIMSAAPSQAFHAWVESSELLRGGDALPGVPALAALAGLSRAAR